MEQAKLPATAPSRPAPSTRRRGFRARVHRDALAFQPDAIAIEERPFPVVARATLYVIVALLAAFAAWATFARIDRIVVSRGKLVTVDPLMVVQPLETAVIRSITVRVGDTVRAGQELVTLDPTFSNSAKLASGDRLKSLSAEAARMRAELDGTPYPSSGAPASGSDPATRLQSVIHAHRVAEYEALVEGFDAEQKRLDAAIATNRQSQADLHTRLAILAEVENMRQQLYASSSGSKLNLLAAELDRATVQESLSEKVDGEQELKEQVAALHQQREQKLNNWTRELGEQLAAVERDITETEQQVTVANRRGNLVVLRAPADGTVLEVAQRSINSVAKEAEPLITLVPRDSTIEADVEVAGADVGRLRVGDPVRLKLDALPYQQFGTLPGQLRILSEGSFQAAEKDQRTNGSDRSSAALFRARMTIDPKVQRTLPPGFRLIPGMAVTADIVIGKRSVISYVLDPIIRLFDEALREP